MGEGEERQKRMSERFIRRSISSSDGYNGGDIDTAVVMFRNAMTWDGDLPSKASRNHFLDGEWARHSNGLQSLTGRGKWAALTCWPMPIVWLRLWRERKLNPFAKRERGDSW